MFLLPEKKKSQMYTWMCILNNFTFYCICKWKGYMYCINAYFRLMSSKWSMVGVDTMVGVESAIHVTTLSPLRQVAILQHIQKMKSVFYLEMLMEPRFFSFFLFLFLFWNINSYTIIVATLLFRNIWKSFRVYVLNWR
jgi:hypothetical protein